ncbi:MAG: OmpH family outer membrane protein [Gammaproteobacteria bacterium]
MNKLLIGFIFILSLGVNAEGTFVLNAEGAMLNTQYAKDAFKELEEDSDFVADKERLELLQSEGQELVEKFQKDNETLSDEQKLDMQKKIQDKQNEIQFLANKLQTKQQEAAQAVVGALAQDFQAVLSELINAKKIELVVTPQSLFYAKPELDITDDVTSGLDVRLAKKSEE